MARNRKRARKDFQESLLYGRVSEGEGEILLCKQRLLKRRGCPTTMEKPALRVIQAHGKFRSNMLVKKVESVVGKMHISQNL